MENVTYRLAEFIANLKFGDIPDKVCSEAKRDILDVIGCCIAGSTTDIGRIVSSFIREFAGKGQATVIGSGERTSCPLAAYANARIGNALDGDDTFFYVGHIGNPIFAASISLCEYKRSSGRDLITSFVAGYEVAARVGLAIGPTVIDDGGRKRYARYANLGTANMIGAAAGAAKAARLTVEQTYQTLNIIGYTLSIPIMRKWGAQQKFIPSAKGSDKGWAAQAGVTAALLAGKGVTGLDDILQGEGGIVDALGVPEGQCDFSLMTEELSKKWYLPQVSFKPWTSCRATHGPLTAFSQIIKDTGLRAEEIDEVIIRGHELTASPRFANQEPGSPIDAQFCHPHAIAMVALGIKLPYWYTPDTLRDPRVHEFRRKVRVELEAKREAMESAAPLPRSGIIIQPSVEVISQGRSFKARSEYPRGDPHSKETYFSDNDLTQKFKELGMVASPLSEEWGSQLDKVIDLVWHLEEVPEVAMLTQMLSPREHSWGCY